VGEHQPWVEEIAPSLLVLTKGSDRSLQPGPCTWSGVIRTSWSPAS